MKPDVAYFEIRPDDRPTQHPVQKGTYGETTQLVQTTSSYSAHKTWKKKMNLQFVNI